MDTLHWLQKGTLENLGLVEMIYILTLIVVKQEYTLSKFINYIIKNSMLYLYIHISKFIFLEADEKCEKIYMLNVIRI